LKKGKGKKGKGKRADGGVYPKLLIPFPPSLRTSQGGGEGRKRPGREEGGGKEKGRETQSGPAPRSPSRCPVDTHRCPEEGREEEGERGGPPGGICQRAGEQDEEADEKKGGKKKRRNCKKGKQKRGEGGDPRPGPSRQVVVLLREGEGRKGEKEGGGKKGKGIVRDRPNQSFFPLGISSAKRKRKKNLLKREKGGGRTRRSWSWSGQRSEVVASSFLTSVAMSNCRRREKRELSQRERKKKEGGEGKERDSAFTPQT